MPPFGGHPKIRCTRLAPYPFHKPILYPAWRPTPSTNPLPFPLGAHYCSEPAHTAAAKLRDNARPFPAYHKESPCNSPSSCPAPKAANKSSPKKPKPSACTTSARASPSSAAWATLKPPTASACGHAWRAGFCGNWEKAKWQTPMTSTPRPAPSPGTST